MYIYIYIYIRICRNVNTYTYVLTGLDDILLPTGHTVTKILGSFPFSTSRISPGGQGFLRARGRRHLDQRDRG